jgi:phosphate transport system protein
VTLVPGSRVGPYEIVEPLGAGGMGEVFRGRDARLKRDVALKVLPSAAAGDVDRRSRFEREAQVLASLNHTTIAQIFGVEMEGIRSGVLSMGGMVEKQLTRAIKALAQEEDADLLDAVGADEAAINRLQINIDQQCAQIIARRQPAAVDLRMVLTVSKIVNDLERIGDEVKKIAYKAAQTRGSDQLTRVRYYDVGRAAANALAMLQHALDAFARLDVERAASIIDEDEAIDAAFSAILRQLISYMMEDPRTITPALEIVFIAKSIERIGDHAKNIAEAVVQVVKGKDVRHSSAQQIRAEVAQP